MLEKSQQAAERKAANSVERVIVRLAQDPPPGVAIEAAPGGIILSGRRLRRRMIDDAALRNFASRSVKR